MGSRQSWDIRRVLIIVTRKWWVLVLTFAGAFGGAWLYIRYTPSTYRADAVVQFDVGGSSTALLGLSSQNTPFLSVELLLEGYMELFSSHDVVEAVVRELDLVWEISSVGKFGTSLIFPNPIQVELRADTVPYPSLISGCVLSIQGSGYELWKNEALLGRGKWGEWAKVKINERGVEFRLSLHRPLSQGKYLIRYVPLSSAVAYWQSAIQILPKRGVTVLGVTIFDISLDRAQAFLTTLLKEMRVYEQSLRQAHYNKMLDYVDTLIYAVQRELLHAQDSIQVFEKKHNIPLADYRKNLLSQAYQNFYNEEVAQRIQDLSLLKQQLLTLLSALNDKAFPVSPIPQRTGESYEILARINELVAQYNQLAAMYQANSPVLRSVELELRNLTHAALELLQVERRLWAERRQKQSSFLNQHIGRAYEDIHFSRQLSLLLFDWELKQKVYQALLERRIEIGVERSAIVSAVRVVQPPRGMPSPISPNRMQIYVLAFLIGAMTGLGWIFLREILGGKISYRVDIEPISPVPVIAELPASSKSDAVEKVGPIQLTTLQLEVLRSLRSSLGFSWLPGKPRIIVVTSTVSGEGKTFLTTSLAYIYAMTGKRTLLVDADLRRATLSYYHGSKQSMGLSNLLASESFLENGHTHGRDEFPSPYIHANLFLLPSGPQVPNPAELLASSRLRLLVEEWAMDYEYILFDTAPVGTVPDTLSILNELPEAIMLYVFRADYSKASFLNHLEDLIRLHRIQRAYLIFNGTRLSKLRYGYGYGYGYYGDSYYYTQPNKARSWWEEARRWLPL